MALVSPLVQKLRTDEEVASTGTGVAPAPDRFEQSRREGNVGRVGAAIARTVSGFNDTLNLRKSTFGDAMRANSEQQATLYQRRTGQPLRTTPVSPPATPSAMAAPGLAPARQTAVTRPTLARPVVVGTRAQDAAMPADPGARFSGSFNGGTITQADADALAQKLPTTNGPVVMGPNATAPNAPINAQQMQAPTLVMPRTLSGDLEAAEKERQARLSDLDSAMFGLRGRLNSRGRRDLYATLLGQQNQLTRDRIDQVTGLETAGAQLANTNAIEQAKLGTQVGEGNANRALQLGELNINATLQREKAADERAKPSLTLRSVDGTTSLLRNDGSLAPLTGGGGKPFREAAEGNTIGDATLFEAYRKDITAINENGLLRPEERAAMLKEVEGRPEYQSVLHSIRKPTLHRFLDAAGQVNPDVTDADLADYYRQQYGED